MAKAKFSVNARLDLASTIQKGTLTIDRDRGIVSVRPARRHREYVMLLDDVAEMICRKIISSEVAEDKPKRKVKVKRGLL
jgi:hypothetical protein